MTLRRTSHLLRLLGSADKISISYSSLLNMMNDEPCLFVLIKQSNGAVLTSTISVDYIQRTKIILMY